ncbi:response regulator transcription factor [Geodermatophilus sp. SYSU D00703]
MSIKVLVADDHRLIRDALAALFAETSDIEVVAGCADGGEVAAAVARTEPDVVLMDVNMPGLDGLAATREVLAAHPGVRVVVLTGALTEASVREAEGLGVAGYLLKEDDPADLPAHVRTVAGGGSVWSRPAAELLDREASGGHGAPRADVEDPYVAESPARLR